MITPRGVLATAEAVLIAHQRMDSRGCFCGWSELGRSYAEHQVAMLDKAAVLATDLAAAVEAAARPCCDLHGRNCEAPADLCCYACTEASHFVIIPRHGGTTCVMNGGGGG